MRKIKQSMTAILAVVLLCLTVFVTGCGGGNHSSESSEAAYKVVVKDGAGNPYTTGVIAKFLQNGEQVAMQAIDGNGVIQKTLTKGEYTVELVFTSGDVKYYYDTANQTLSADKTELEIVVAYEQSEECRTLYVEGAEVAAYNVMPGTTHVSLEEGRNYFLFTPKTAGTYKVSVSNTAVLGYYGAPHFVQSHNAAEIIDNTFEISVSQSMIGSGDTGTAVYVIGVDAEKEEMCFLNVMRTGDPKETIEDKPWTIYKKTVDISPYVLNANAQISEFDLKATTDTYNLVYNKEDGFYHLNTEDGPVVLVRLAKDSSYLVSFKTILDSTGVNKYFFNESKEFVKKESYSECLLEYIACADEEEGVYPLTEDLKYIIQQHGEYVGWWKADSHSYLFKDTAGNPVPGINNEIAWLFMCCYVSDN